MNRRLMIGIVLSFSSGIFSMDLALPKECIEKGQGLKDFLACDDFEVKIFDKNMFNTLTHYNARFTITDNQYDIRYCYKGGGDKIPQEKRWEFMPIFKNHLDEIEKKSKIFYLCAFGKGEYERNHDPVCSIRIVQTIVDRGGHHFSVQLEDPDKKSASIINWHTPSARIILLQAFTPLVRSYHSGYLGQCRSILSAVWKQIAG